MDTLTSTLTQWTELTYELGKSFEARAENHDREGSFVFQNYEALKSNKFFSAAVPEEHGGGGISHQQMCNIIRTLAHYCSSTALAFSMHQHLIAAAIWRFKHKGEAIPLLQKVAKEEIILVSTGARDWLDSNGELTTTEVGYLLSATKPFASGSVIGDIAITSAPFLHPEEGWQVLHFPVSLKANGVSLLDDWDVLGMRATGSQTVRFEKVFVPDSAIVLRRPRNGYHPVWDVTLTVAMPLIMSAYVGVAEKAMELALSLGKKNTRYAQHLPYLIGKINNAMVSARTQWKQMYRLTNNMDFKPSEQTTIDILSLKTNVVDSCMAVVQQAMEVVGGQSFYKGNVLERLLRDIQGAPFHPLPAWEQYAFTGSRLLKQSVL